MTIQLTVPTIACEACAEAVTKAVQNEDAQATVQVDLTSKKSHHHQCSGGRTTTNGDRLGGP